jgi:acetolactate synthase I/II/III large subunit
LCEEVEKIEISKFQRMNTTKSSVPEKSSLETALKWINSAKNPLIITADLGRFVSAPEVLVRFSESIQAGVIEFGKRNFYNFPTEHPHHLGFDPLPHLLDSDLVISIECPVPWIPKFLPKSYKLPTVISIRYLNIQF